MSGNLEQRLWEAIEDKDYRKATFFLRNGAQADRLLEDGIAVIHFLSGIVGDEANQLLLKCLENGASPNITSCDGITPVHVAAIWGIFDNLSTLIEYGGNIDVIDADGMSPLEYAEQSEEYQSTDCVKLLTDLVHDNKEYTYTKIKSKPDSVNVNRRKDLGKSSSVEKYDGNKASLAANDDKPSFHVLNPSRYYYTDERDLLTEDETSTASIDQTEDSDSTFVKDFTPNVENLRQATRGSRDQHVLTHPDQKCYINGRAFMSEDESSTASLDQTEDGYSSFIKDFTHIENPRQATRGSRDQHVLTQQDQKFYIDGRDFMSEDESSSGSLISASSSSSFHTAKEGEISMAFTSVLDDTVVTFPKLHPWMSATQNKMDLDDTIIDGINDLDIRNTSENLDSTSSNIVIDNSINCTLSDGTVLYDWKEYSILEIPPSSDELDTSFVIPEALLNMGCQQLKEELLKLGDDPGPIRADTRMLYVRRLARIQSGLADGQQYSDRLKEYLPEVRAVIEGRLPSPEMDPVEESMCVDFTKQHLRSKWREGTEKSSFNYLLLDPRVTQNLPVRSKKMAYEDVFHTFVAAIFYVGKGKRSRPYAHLHEAINLNKTNRKLQQIRDIWEANLGVVSIHCFQGVIPVEAYTREACLVEALGLARLTNKKKCDYYGRAKTWSLKKKREMGVSLLKRGLQIFLNEGERQLRPEDLKRSK